MANSSLQAAAAASNEANAGLFDYIGTLSIATKITTLIGLAALAVLCAFILSRLWLVNRQRAIEKALDKGDDGALDALLGNNVSLDSLKLDGLAREQRLQIFHAEIRQRFWGRVIGQAMIFFVVLAALTVMALLLRPKPAAAETQAVDPISMTNLLKFVPEDQRQAECVKSPGFSADLCARIVASIAGAYSKPKTPEVETAVKETITRGRIAPAFATAISSVTIGAASGWDVDFFWCEGDNEARNKAAAEAAAAALGQTPGEKLTPAVRLGNIRVMARSASAQLADAPQANSGALILSDASSGKNAAVAAILSTLTARGQARYKMQTSATPKRWNVQVFDCAQRLRRPQLDVINPDLLRARPKQP